MPSGASRPVGARGGRAALDLLRREPDFRRTYLATLVSLGGDWFAVVPLLVLLPRLTGGGLAGALVLAADTAVFALLSPYAGTMVDRVDRRRLLVAADLASAGCAVLLLAVDSAGTAWIAVVGIGGVAGAKAFAQPAAQAALPNLVDSADLRLANVLTGTAWGSMLAVGAALGGLGAAVLGERACFLVDAASFLVSAALIYRCRRPFQRERTASAGRTGVGEAVRYVKGEPRVLALLAVKPGVAFANGALVLFPLLTADVFGVGGIGVGLLFAARGLGALLGPLLLGPRVRDDTHLHRVLALSIAACGLAYVCVALAPAFWLVLVLVTLGHIGGGANWVASTYGLQAVVPDAVLGRVASTDFMLVTLVVAANQVVAGLLSGVVDTRLLTGCFGAASLAYAAVWWSATARARPGAVPR
ncbi:MAG TPA: MFS transporter [Mycobacteriales bacterium]|nr:MFS transporter [Mycobacteriales bacterium]